MTKPYFEDDAVQIWHGDCRDVLPKLQADVVLTDPPYGVGAKYDGSYQDKPGAYWDWFPAVVTQMRQSARVVAFTHRVFSLGKIDGWDWIGAWTKPYAAGARIGNSWILPHWEPIYFFGVHAKGTDQRGISRYRSDVFDFNPLAGGPSRGFGIKARNANENNGAHPTPKPLPLFAELVTLLTEPGQTVLDPFMGSGTTLRAAKNLGRRAIGIEISERYCQEAVERMAQTVMPLEVKGGEKAPR